MVNSKLILLLKSFSNKEFREFSKFVASPYFNQKQEVNTMFEAIRKARPDFSIKKIERKYIMKKVFPSEVYSEKKYKYISNLLLKLAENYISLKEMESRPMIREYHLLNAYVNREIDKNYNFIHKKAHDIQEQSEKRNADFYYREYLLKNVAAKHFDKKKVRKNNEPMAQLLNALDIYYFANKLKHTCHTLSNEKVISSSFNTSIPKEIIHFLNQTEFTKYPAIHLYFTLYQLLTEENEKYFDKMKSLLETYYIFFEADELKDVYYAIINYCIRQLRKNNHTEYYLLELYRIYQQGISTGLLLENGLLSPWTYKNVIRLGLRLKRYESTELFIQNNKSKLKEEFQSDAFHANMAELSFHKKDYNNALQYLNNVEYSDIYYILDTKLLRLKIFFENDDYDVLESNLSAFHTYLKRNKLITENIKESYLNFTKFLGKIIRNEHKKILLKEEIEKSTPLMDKSWLLGIVRN